MEQERIDFLHSVAGEVSKDIVRMVGVARSGPLALPLVLVDILVYLYWEELVILPSKPKREDRDRLVFGIQDFSPALYAVLAFRGYFDREELWHYRRLGAMLQAMPDFKRTPGIDAPCVVSSPELFLAAPLASSLPAYCGTQPRVVCMSLLCDFDDASFMPEAKRIAEQGVSNLILIVIFGESCGFHSTEERAKQCMSALSSIGWETAVVDGHNFSDMESAFGTLNYEERSPKALFIATRNASKFSFVRNANTKLQGCMSIEDMDQALEELEGSDDGNE